MSQQICEVITVFGRIVNCTSNLSVDFGEELELSLDVFDNLSIERSEYKSIFKLKRRVKRRIDFQQFFCVCEWEKHMYNLLLYICIIERICIKLGEIVQLEKDLVVRWLEWMNGWEYNIIGMFPTTTKEGSSHISQSPKHRDANRSTYLPYFKRFPNQRFLSH